MAKPKRDYVFECDADLGDYLSFNSSEKDVLCSIFYDGLTPGSVILSRKEVRRLAMALLEVAEGMVG